MTDLDLIIFDCDGVLIDSEVIATQIEVELLATAGYAISLEDLTERFCGMTWKNILLAVETESGLALMDRLLDKTEAILDRRLAEEVQMIEGVDSVLERISHKRCICSNTKSSRLDVMLTKVGLKSFFTPHIFSAKDLGEDRAKPKPDIFLHGARMMNAAPARTIVIEDSVHGVEGARAAGMTVIGFTGGRHTYRSHADSLIAAGASTTISQMVDLPRTIAALLDRVPVADDVN